MVGECNDQIDKQYRFDEVTSSTYVYESRSSSR